MNYQRFDKIKLFYLSKVDDKKSILKNGINHNENNEQIILFENVVLVSKKGDAKYVINQIADYLDYNEFSLYLVEVQHYGMPEQMLKVDDLQDDQISKYVWSYNEDIISPEVIIWVGDYHFMGFNNEPDVEEFGEMLNAEVEVFDYKEVNFEIFPEIEFPVSNLN